MGRIESCRSRSPLDDLGDGTAGEVPVGDVSMAVHGPQQRTAGGVEADLPGREDAFRAGGGVDAPWQAEADPRSVLVTLGAPDGEDESIVMRLDVIEVELRELGAPERCSEADDEEGVIASPGRARIAGCHHHAESFEGDGLHPTLGGPEVAAGEVPVALYLGRVYGTRVTCDQVRATDR